MARCNKYRYCTSDFLEVIKIYVYLFLVYLTALLVAQTVDRKIIRLFMNNILENMREEAVAAWLNTLSRNLPGGTEENNEKLRKPFSLPRYEPGTLRVRNRSADVWAVAFHEICFR